LFSAIAGAGEGVYPYCAAAELGIRTINNQGADANGNFKLDGDGCAWTERPLLPDMTGFTMKDPDPAHPYTDYETTMPPPNTLKLHSDCLACCDCLDYGNAYKAVKQIYDEAAGVAARIEAARVRYNELAAAVAPCSGASVKLRVSSDPDYTFSLHVVVYNRTGGADSPTLRLTLSQSDPTGNVFVTNSGRLFVGTTKTDVDMTPIGGTPYLTYDVPLGTIANNQSARYFGRMRWSALTASSSIVVTALAVLGGAPYTATQTETLKAPEGRT
jgi:hypothetical protein